MITAGKETTMKSKTTLYTGALALLLSATGALAQSNVINTFTYQGQIAVQAGDPTAFNTVTFTFYTAVTGGSWVNPPETNNISVNSNGVFTTLLNFGSLTFSNPPYYLEIALATNPAGPFTTLTPRQLLTPTPNSTYAFSAGTAANFAGSVGGDISGTQGSLIVNTVGGVSAANVAVGASAANAANSANVANTIVKRDGTGSFTAQNLTLNGTLNLPDPAVIYAGPNVFVIEEGSLYVGKNGGSPVINNGDTLHNTGFGDFALNHEASTASGGSYNTAVGDSALFNNTSGVNNTAIGVDALFFNTSGNNNTALGENALYANTNGLGNTAVGNSALLANIGGGLNTAIGFEALGNNTFGNNNIALGYYAGQNITLGGSNIDIGNTGISGDADTIRIGVQGIQASAYMAGIYGTALPTNSPIVVVDSSGQLGTETTLPSISLAGTYGNPLNFNNIGNTFTGNGNGLTSLNAAQLTGGPVPSAVISGTYANAVTLNNSGNSFTGNGAGLSNVNATLLNGFGYCNLPCYWNITGNGSTTPGTDFVGTTDNNRLELHVNSTRALVLYPDPTGNNSANLLGGFTLNAISGSDSGDVIAGGGYPGNANVISNASWSAIGGGSGNQIYFANLAVIGGGYQNLVSAFAGTVGGGTNNTAGYFGTVAGGAGNTASTLASVGGGQANMANFTGASIGGGYDNIANGSSFGYATVAGGISNSASADYSFIGGGSLNAISSSANQAVIGGGSGNSVQSSSTAAAIVGGAANRIGTSAADAFIGAGGGNNIQANSLDSVIGGGLNNTNGSGAGYSVIGGGDLNQANSGWTVIGGGNNNLVGSGGFYGTIAGGSANVVGTSTTAGTIAGGSGNVVGASTTGSTIGGGANNTNSGQYATIPGGQNNLVGGSGAFAAGLNAITTKNGSFVWGDDSGVATTVFANNQFMARASGGVVFLSGTAASPTSYATGTAGVALQPNGTSWGTISDRNAKKNFSPVDGKAVLEKLAAIPVQEWNYKWEKDSDVPNIGPMAQDFKAAFYPGRNETSITTLEFDGVELAAIQGLNEKLEEQVKQKDARIQSLEERLERLEKIVSHSTSDHGEAAK